MELSWLEDLVALAECRSFSRAADTRNLTQPAFSRRVRALEVWAGMPLVDRTTHPISLTPSGQVFLVAARDVIRRLHQGRQEADAAARLPTLRFAATHALSLTFFPKWLRSLGPRAATPMHLIADNMKACERLMLEGRAEFLLCHHHPLAENRLSPTHFHWVKVGEDVLLPVSQRLANGCPRFCFPGTADAPVPLLAFDDHSGMGQIIAATLPRHDGPVHGRVVFTSHLAVALKNLALDGEGVAWAPLSLVSEDLAATGPLAAAAGPDWQIPIDIVLARPKARQSNMVESFWALIEQQSV